MIRFGAQPLTSDAIGAALSTATGIVTIGYPARVDGVTNELFWRYTGPATNSGPGTQHLDAAGISAFPFRGSDNYEHLAVGAGNSGAGSTFGLSSFVEASHYPQQSTTAPYPLKFIQTGYNSNNAAYENTRRQIFTADYKTEFYDGTNTLQYQITAAGRLQGPNGSISAPSFSFINDPDTGPYSPSANAYGIAAGGKRAVQFDAPGSLAYWLRGEANNQPKWTVSTDAGASDIALQVGGKGLGGLDAIDGAGNYVFRSVSVASAVNYLRFFNGASGTNPTIGTNSGTNLVLGGGDLATNATSGFIMVPTCAGTPTGAPTGAGSGQAALIVDRTNNKLYFYSGSAWRDAGP